MIKTNKELGNGLFAQMNWTKHDVQQMFNLTDEDAEAFLLEMEEDLLDIMANAGEFLLYAGEDRGFEPADLDVPKLIYRRVS
jgi:hypothetical protein